MAKFGKKEEVVPEYTKYPKLVKGEFVALVKEQAEINEMMGTLKSRHKEIGESLTALMIAAKAAKVMVGKLRATRSTGKNSRIDGQQLLSKGVSSDVIVACTVTQTYEYTVVKDTSESDAGGLVE